MPLQFCYKGTVKSGNLVIPNDVQHLLRVIQDWAKARDTILGLAVVGSWARGTAQKDSDLDIMLLVDSPKNYRAETNWLATIEWHGAGFHLDDYRDADYGKAWSRHVRLIPSAEVEFTFADKYWAATDPIDEGTKEVIANGCHILLDNKRLFARLLEAVQNKAPN